LEQSPGTRRFDIPGVYIVTETNSSGDSDTASVQITVTEPVQNSEPAAAILSPDSDTVITAGESVSFRGDVTAGNAPFDFSWDFGDSGIEQSDQIIPGETVFENPGVYIVTFTVAERDNPENTDSATVRVTVNEVIVDTRPVATILSPVSDVVVNAGEPVKLEGAVTSGDEPFAFSWDFGGSGVPQASEMSPGEMPFDRPGVFIVTFTVTERDNPADTDSATVRVTVNEVVVNTGPTATIVSPASDVVVNAGEPVKFEGAITSGDEPSAFSWDFCGSGVAQVSGMSPGEVVFENAGDYVITFTVTERDNPADTDSATIRVTVNEIIVDTRPVAEIVSPGSEVIINAGDSVSFEGLVTDGDAPFDFSWDFGESGIAQIREITPGETVFEKPGVYIVTFTVTKRDNPADTDSVIVRVTVNEVVVNTRPVAAVISPVSDVVADAGDSVSFEGMVTDGDAPFDFLWDFGDSGVAKISDITPGKVVFDRPGVYIVTFTVTRSKNVSQNQLSCHYTVRRGPDMGYSGLQNRSGAGDCKKGWQSLRRHPRRIPAPMVELL